MAAGGESARSPTFQADSFNHCIRDGIEKMHMFTAPVQRVQAPALVMNNQ